MNDDKGRLSGERPWPGLASFSEENREFFHGRDQETEELNRLVQRELLTSLFGQSGLGKTSLLKAGLYPVLRQADFMPVHLRLDLGDEAPPPVAQVAAACAREAALYGVEVPAHRAGETLWEYLNRRDNCWWSGAQPVIPVLVFDQFEEIFSLGRANPARQARCDALIDELTWLVEGIVPSSLARRIEAGDAKSSDFDFRRRDFRVLFVFREDFLAEFEGLRKRIRSLFHSRLRLERFKAGPAAGVITSAGGHLLAPGVAARIVAFVAGSTGDVEPALLSLVCEQLNELRIAQGQATVTGELLEGSRDEILRQFYVGATRDCAPSVREFIEDRLITDSGFRIPLPKADCLRAEGVTDQVIETLVARRLLRVDPGSGVERIELIHDVLTGVVLAARRARAEAVERARLERATSKARRQARIAYGVVALALLACGYVFQLYLEISAAKDREAVALKRSQENERRATENETLAVANASEAEREKRAAVAAQGKADLSAKTAEEQRGRAVAAAEAAQRERLKAEASQRAAVAAERQRLADLMRSTVRTLQSDSKSILDGSIPDSKSVAVLLAVATARLAPDHPDSLRALLSARASTDRLALLKDHGVEPWAIDFSPDGRLVAYGTADGMLHFMNTADGAPRQSPVKAHALRITAVVFSPDGSRIATGGTDNKVRLWDARSGNAVGNPMERHSDWVRAVAFTPDGAHLVSVGDDARLLKWNTATRTLVRELGGSGTQSIAALAYSPDGKRVAVATGNGLRLYDAATAAPLAPAQDGHRNRVTAIAWSPDGSVIATGSFDDTIRFWNAERGTPVGDPLQGHDDTVKGLAFSPDGRALASASDDRTVRIWDPATRRQVHRLAGHTRAVFAIAYSPDGRFIASGSDDDTIRLWDAVSGRPASQVMRGHGDSVRSLAFSPDGKVLASGADDKTVRVWNPATGREIGAMAPAHDGSVSAVAFSPDGARIVSGSADGTLRLWDAVKRTAIGKPAEGHQLNVNTVAFSPDGTRIASGSNNDRLRLWDAHTLATEMPPNPRHRGYVYAVAVSSDGKHVATGGDDHHIRIWDADTGVLVRTLRGHTASVRSLAFNAPGTRLVSGATNASGIVWNTATGQSVARHALSTGGVLATGFSPDGDGTALYVMNTGVLARGAAAATTVTTLGRVSSSTVRYARFDPGTTRVALTSTDRSVALSEVSGARSLSGNLPSAGFNLQGAALNPAGDTIAAVGASPALMRWALPAGSMSGAESFWRQPSRIRVIALSPDGTRLATGARDRMVRIWDTRTGWQVREPLRGHTDWVQGLAYSPDGKLLASAGNDRTLRFWDAASGEPRGVIQTGHTGNILSLAFSPDGRLLATSAGAPDRTAKLWNVATREQSGPTLSAHQGGVWDAAFSPDGLRLVTASVDQTLQQWDIATGKPIGEPMRGHKGEVHRVLYSPDGRMILSGGREGLIRLWDAASGEPAGFPMQGHTESVWGLRFLAGGSRIVSASFDRTLRVWSTTTGKPIGAPMQGHPGGVESVVVSADGSRVYSADLQGNLRVWDAATLALLAAPAEGTQRAIAYSPDGAVVATAGDDQRIRLWSTANWQPLGEPLQGHERAISTLAFSPDGRHLLSGANDGEVLVWDLATRKGSRVTLAGDDAGKPVKSLRFSPDGRRVAGGIGTNDAGTLLVWKFTPAAPWMVQERRSAEHERAVTAVEFSADGQRIVSASDDATIRVWNADTLASVGIPIPAGGAIKALALTHGGSRILSGGADGALRLWDTASGRPLTEPLRGNDSSSVVTVAASRDGRRVVTASANGALRSWSLDVAEHVALLCGIVTRELTDAEWDRYIGKAIARVPACPRAR